MQFNSWYKTVLKFWPWRKRKLDAYGRLSNLSYGYYKLHFCVVKSSCYPWGKEWTFHSIKGIANTFADEFFGSEINIFLKVPSTHLSSLFLCVCLGKKPEVWLWWKLKCFIYSYNTCSTQQEHRLLFLSCQYLSVTERPPV